MNRITFEETKGIPVLVAAGRKKRPHIQGAKPAGCPFDAGHEKETPVTKFQLPNNKWEVRCFNNKFPATKLHEVIVETPHHDEQFRELAPTQLETLWKAYVNRYQHYTKQRGVKCICLFKNHGKEGGASLAHEHTQLVAVPFIPPTTASEQAHFDSFKRKTGKCFYCQLSKDKQQVLFKHAGYVVVVPKFARFPKECWVVPEKHALDITKLNSKLLEAVQLALHAMHKGEEFPYDVVYHNPALGTRDFHCHAEIIPRGTIPAGLELGWNLWINQEDQKQAVKEMKTQFKTQR